MINQFSISINPSYFCNFRCNFCYLTSAQLGDQKKISIRKLDELLKQVPKISHIDLYGGEIGALKRSYYEDIIYTIRDWYSGVININTNFSMLDDRFFKPGISLSVSYDFQAREKADIVFQNMLMSPVPIAVLILASPKVLKLNVDEMIKQLNMCKKIKSVEIKPYSINQANAHEVSHKDFEEFVIKWIDSSIKKKFTFQNWEKIKNSLKKEYNAWSDNHVYITPNGNFAVLEFDKEDKEYFLELPTFAAYEKWAEEEKIKISPICKKCEWLGGCLTEHYRYVKDLSNSCNGYLNLLNKYKYTVGENNGTFN